MKTFFKELPYAASQALTGRFVDALRNDVEISVDIEKDIDTGNFESLCGRSMAYSYGDRVANIIGNRQLLAFFGKNLAVPLTVDRKRVAFDKFLESEASCRLVNRRIRTWSRTGHNDSYVESVLFTAQRKIASILGPVPSLDLLQLAFGPGANSNVKKNTSARWKLSAVPACSTNMLGMISDLLSELPLVCNLWKTVEDEESWTVPVEVSHGELMFVAKNARTDRSIIIEPSLNTLIQKGVGTYMKARLLNHGINLFDQTIAKTSNQQRARMASIRNDLMTVDLSSASDSIATLLVMELLPYEWFEFLSTIRTSKVISKDFNTEFELEKFSSMGNGFTFELESLIFYALTHAVCITDNVIPDVSVYGDDIIAPKEIFLDLKRVFDAIGFTINSEKSYIDGPFRESCGGDYFLGQDVRPYYQKSNWSLATLYSFHNFLYRTGRRFLFPCLFDEVLKAIPVDSRLYGPDGYGDGHLLGDWSPIPHGRTRGWCGWVFQTRVQAPRILKKFLLPGDCILPFYSAYIQSGGTNHFSIRGATGKCRRINVYTLSRQ